MENQKTYFAVKALILVLIVGLGIYACLTMDRHVTDALMEVETVQMSRVEFRESIPIRGSVYSEGGEWYVAAGVDESDISGVAVGQSAEISGAAFPEPVGGSVTEIADAAYSENGRTAVRVIIKLDGKHEELRSGYSAEGSIYEGETRLLRTLPYEAIRQDSEGEYVYVFSGNKAVLRRIETGVELSDKTEIVNGLSEQSEVILSPDGVTDQALVRKERAE